MGAVVQIEESQQTATDSWPIIAAVTSQDQEESEIQLETQDMLTYSSDNVSSDLFHSFFIVHFLISSHVAYCHVAHSMLINE